MDRIANFYAQPSYVGAGFPIFSGSRRQRGGNIFGAIKNMFMPIVKSVLKRGAKAAIGAAGHFAGDVLAGRNAAQSAKRNAKRVMVTTGKAAMNELANRISPPAKRPRLRPQAKRRPKAKQSVNRRGKANF